MGPPPMGHGHPPQVGTVGYGGMAGMHPPPPPHPHLHYPHHVGTVSGAPVMYHGTMNASMYNGYNGNGTMSTNSGGTISSGGASVYGSVRNTTMTPSEVGGNTTMTPSVRNMVMEAFTGNLEEERQIAKKSSDPAVQLEFAKKLILAAECESTAYMCCDELAACLEEVVLTDHSSGIIGS